MGSRAGGSLDRRRARRAARHQTRRWPRRLRQNKGMNGMETPPIHITAGPQRVTAAFIQRFEGPVDDLIAPIEHTLAERRSASATASPPCRTCRDFSIVGPDNGDRRVGRRRAAARSSPAVRRRRRRRRRAPRRSSRDLATQAYRGTGGATRRAATLMKFYDEGRKDGRFRERHPLGARSRSSPARTSCSAWKAGRRRRRRAGQPIALGRPRSGVAAVVLPLGQRCPTPS